MRVCASSACSNVSIKIQFFEKVLRQQHCSGEQARYCKLQDIVLLLYGTKTREGIEAPKPVGYGATLQCLGPMLYCIKPSFRDVAETTKKGKERKGKERKGKERKGKERKRKERKGKERKGKEIFIFGASIPELSKTTRT